MPEDDVRILAVAVRGGERDHGAAVGDDPCLHAVGVGERVELHVGAIGRFAECLFFTSVFGSVFTSDVSFVAQACVRQASVRAPRRANVDQRL